METTSFKALSIQRLQGKQQGNQEETLSFLDGNQGVDRFASTSPDDLTEREYLETLTLFRSPRAEKLTEVEAYNMVSRLDELFQKLTREGRQLPVNTREGKIYVRGAAGEIQDNEESLH